MTEHEVLRLALRALYGFIPYLPIEHDKQQCERYDEAVSAIEDKLTGYAQSQIDKAISYSEVMKQALNVLLLVEAEMNCEYGVTESLRQAIAEAEKPEPDDLTIAYMTGLYDGKKQAKQEQDKEWVGLTDEDIEDCYIEELYLFAVALEAKLKQKNNIGENNLS